MDSFDIDCGFEVEDYYYEQEMIRSDYDKGIHTCKDGRRIYLKDMSDSHLHNAERYFRKSWRHDYLWGEIMRRKHENKMDSEY